MNWWKQRSLRPSPDLQKEGVAVVCWIDMASDARGAMFTDEGFPRLRFETEPNRSAHSFLNLLGKPEFVMFDPAGTELLRIRRCARLPPRFEMIDQGRAVGEIEMRSVLRNKYRISLVGDTAWTFRMPLFTIIFRGESTDGSQVWVAAGPRKVHWNILLTPHRDSLYLLSALAFIHREWWCYS